MFEERPKLRKKYGRRDLDLLKKFDCDLPALELERARLFSEFGEGWVREYWRRHPDLYLQPGEKF